MKYIYLLEHKEIDFNNMAFQERNPHITWLLDFIKKASWPKYSRLKKANITSGFVAPVAFTTLTGLLKSIGLSDKYDMVNDKLNKQTGYRYKVWTIRKIKLIHQDRNKEEAP